MHPFTAHPSAQGFTYLAHMRFALGIARRLLASVTAFSIHAVFPFVDIRHPLDLEATRRYLAERDAWLERRKRRSVPAWHTPVTGRPEDDSLAASPSP